MCVFQISAASPVSLLHPLQPGCLCPQGPKEGPKEVVDIQHFMQ